MKSEIISSIIVDEIQNSVVTSSKCSHLQEQKTYRASSNLSQAAIFSFEIFSSEMLLAGINSALQLRATYIFSVEC